VGEDPSRITHKILDDSENASDENDAACEVEVADVLAPGDIR